MFNTGVKYRDAFRAAKADPGLTKGLRELLPSPASKYCPECLCGANPFPGLQGALTDRDSATGLKGLVAFLPACRDIASWSVVHKQPTINEGSYQHPCLILEVSACGHYVFCVPVTSFGGRGIRAKHAGKDSSSDVFWQYLALQHASGSVDAHNDLGELEYDGAPLDKQSYVRLVDGYWIEWRMLRSFRSQTTGCPSKDTAPGRLTPKALQQAEKYYAIAEQQRQAHRASPAVCTPSVPRTYGRWTQALVAQQQPRWAAADWRRPASRPTHNGIITYG